mgnify:CR=1 FL=1
MSNKMALDALTAAKTQLEILLPDYGRVHDETEALAKIDAAIAALQAEPQLAPHLCIAPACGTKCSDCNSAISDATMRRYAIRYSWLRGHVGEMWAGSGFQWAARHDEIDNPADAAALDEAVEKAMMPLPTPPKD